MNARSLALASLSIASCFAVACSGAPNADEDANVGVATATITQVPPQVSCVDIQVNGSRSFSKKFDVTAGQTSVLSLSGLPTGNVTFIGLAYPLACASVVASTTATWLSQPVPATLIAGAAP